MKIFKFIVAILVLGLSGCTIHEKIHFNNDFSGSCEYMIDFTMITAMVENDSSSNTDNEEMREGLTELQTKMEQIEGISEVKFDADLESGIVRINYNFENTNALNEALSMEGYDMDDPTANSRQKYSAKRNKLIMEFYTVNNDSIEDEAFSMMSMIEYVFEYSFDRGIKDFECNRDDFVFTQEGNVIKQEGNFDDLMKMPEKVKCTIKLNRK